MTWTRAQYGQSLDEWRSRETRYRRNWRSKRRSDPRRYYWFKLLKHAVRMVGVRETQLAAFAVRGVGERGLSLIKEFEGFQRVRRGFPNTAWPYRDPKGIWTIGYGETRGISRFTRPWSRAMAERRLVLRVNRDYLAPVLRLVGQVGLVLSQNEADALASLVYNLGPGILNEGRTMGDAIRSKNINRIADAFLVYSEPNNPVVHEGLLRRRKAERSLFLS